MAITGTLEDREEVRALHARYCLTIDTGRFEEWIDCFTDDGIFESPRFGKHSGRDGLKRFAAMYKESLGGAQVLHVVANPAFEIDGDNGSGTSLPALLSLQGRQGAAVDGGLLHRHAAQDAGRMALCEPPGDDPRASLDFQRGQNEAAPDRERSGAAFRSQRSMLLEGGVPRHFVRVLHFPVDIELL